MEQIYLIVISVLIVAGLLLLFVLKPDLLKKYWGYIALSVAAVGGVIFFLTQRKGQIRTDPEMEKKEKRLQEDLKRVHEEAEAQVQEARVQEIEVHQEVEEIKKIDDDEERLRRLADLFNRTRRHG